MPKRQRQATGRIYSSRLEAADLRLQAADREDRENFRQDNRIYRILIHLIGTGGRKVFSTTAALEGLRGVQSRAINWFRINGAVADRRPVCRADSG
jgi:hypothetical protein